MSVPPPPNQWGPQPPTGGQPVAGQQSGAAPGGQPGGVPKWGPQQPWGPPPGTPPGRGGKGKWILAGIAVLAVIAVTVVITVLVVGKDSGSSPNQTPTNGNGSDFASANDKGPVGLVTEDATCAAWQRIAGEYSAQAESVKWGDRDQTIPADAWTADQRTMYDTVGKAVVKATDQTVSLVKLTPHRVMRELYEQFVAYGRAFTNKVTSYTAQDRYLAGATDGITSALSSVCSAIDYKSAQPLAPLIPEAASPKTLAALGDPNRPERFLTSSNPVCSDWTSELSKFDADSAAWRAMDPQIPADQWTPEQKAVNEAVAPVMSTHADSIGRLARQSDNAVFEDVGVLSAQYQRAFVKAIPTYSVADNYLSEAATFLSSSVNAACKATAG
jgi:hypothetical protein